ncbi:MAG: triose-phosphate isomerase [bacterium]|nr:triose-phosphate isomerase [bacterium]
MKVLIVSNWKMNPPSFREAKRLLEATKKAVEHAAGVSVVVTPPALYLRELRAASRSKKIAFAAQNAHAEMGGAFTGEISMRQVKDSRVSYVLIGHAERRAMGETNDDTRRKIGAALGAGLVPIFCVGEAKRDSGGEHFGFIRDQLRAGLVDTPPVKISKIIIAYEPVWAIGAESAMSPRDMHEMAIFIRKTIVDLHGAVGHSVKILYGGSIAEKNAPAMLMHGDVDGLLVGRASANPERITLLLEAVGDTRP